MAIGKMLLCGAALSIALGVGAASADSQLKSPDQVQKALGILNRVVDHTGRLIAAKNYAQLPGENNEFKQGSQALDMTLAGEPAEFKSRVDPLLAKANMESENIAKAANAHDDSKLAASHEALANSVKEILAFFPADALPPQPNLAEERQEEKARETTGSGRQ
jgi:hypothetical protein